MGVLNEKWCKKGGAKPNPLSSRSNMKVMGYPVDLAPLNLWKRV